MTEAELLAHVLAAAAELGVIAHHSGDSRADAGDPGFPDLVLVGFVSLEFWELKSAVGILDRRQALWRERLMFAGATHRIVRPDSWPDEIYSWLRAIRDGREEKPCPSP